MMLRFRYGNVNNEYEYQDHQLYAIDSCLDEDQIRQRFADTYRSCRTGRGRTPLDPVIAYKAHLLYFLKRDIISFNELPEQINAKADYRAFCRSQGVSFTAGYLSIFRKYHLTSGNSGTTSSRHPVRYEDPIQRCSFAYRHLGQCAHA